MAAVDSVPVAPECMSPDTCDNGEEAVLSVETGRCRFQKVFAGLF